MTADTPGWISEAEERLDAATPGPWRIPVANVFRVVQPLEADPRSQPRVPWIVVAEAEEAADAEFIAHAPADLRRALDALTAVLALHQRITRAGAYEYGDVVEWECCDQCDEDWPCPTVRAITGEEA